MPRQYFYEKYGKQIGPVSLEEMLRDHVSPNTYIWFEGLEEWIQLKDDATTYNAYTDLQKVTPPSFEKSIHQQNVENRLDKISKTLGYKESTQVSEQMPNNYFALSIMSVLCGCWPLGIIAIFHAVQVKKLYEAGYKDQALVSSKKAYIFSMIAILSSLILLPFLIFTGGF